MQRRILTAFLDRLVPANRLNRAHIPSITSSPHIYSAAMTSPLTHEKEPINTAIVDTRSLKDSELSLFLYRSSSQIAQNVQRNGRILFLSTLDPLQSSMVEGLVRSLSKELASSKGATCNLGLTSSPDSPTSQLADFFLSNRSAFVNGQVVRQQPKLQEPESDICVVTGGARGIGLEIAKRLKSGSRCNKVYVVDHPSSDFSAATECGFETIGLDITAPDTPSKIMSAIDAPIGCLVHSAGITADKTMKRMSLQSWRSCLDVNLHSIIKLDSTFENKNFFDKGCRIVGVASTSGIAGNVGQCNYAASKSGLIGWSEKFNLINENISYNTVAPGFIQTQMTDKLPPMVTFMATKIMTPLKAKGQVEDVAEVCGMLVEGDFRGERVRVCGGMLIGK
ncbi:hypothetical protein TrST_g5759 [Triparma strigata]|uniref:Ketoreductase domain-containing protein n=1 Tax=Triparma strigata TaxID=1606541 RepID=A0A9W6ZGQ6_9STRA|nr:hypothetical protein TrST_g5759 [Triparma strigata]